jgi:hypothetical protein
MSKRQQIVNAVDARFKAIKIANGYNTDLGNKVYRWKSTDIDRIETMALIYRDLKAPVLDAPHNKSDHNLLFEADIIAKAGTLTDDEVRKMLDDVNKAIGVDWTWGGLAIRTAIIENAISDIEQADKIVGVGKIIFEILYRTNLFGI